jgi:uncharacterized protein
MKICQKIVESLEPRCQNLKIKDVRIGLGYTAVQLDDGHAGVAFTMGKDAEECCSAFPGTAPLAGRPAVEFLRLLESPFLLETVVGLATANALANVRPAAAVAGDVLDALAVLPQDKVAMIGYFAPLISSLEERVARLDVFDECWECATHVRPPHHAPDVLPTCDVALITSTTLINDTIDRLLKSAVNCREVVLLGSSTPLLPEAFRGTPVTLLSGITVDDPAGILRVVSEGRGTRLFKPFASKWNLPVWSPVG